MLFSSYNNQTYRIDEIAWDKTPSDEFEGRNGEKLSYLKYYAEKYNRNIKDPKQPLLISIAKVGHHYLYSFLDFLLEIPSSMPSFSFNCVVFLGFKFLIYSQVPSLICIF